MKKAGLALLLAGCTVPANPPELVEPEVQTRFKECGIEEKEYVPPYRLRYSISLEGEILFREYFDGNQDGFYEVGIEWHESYGRNLKTYAREPYKGVILERGNEKESHSPFKRFTRLMSHDERKWVTQHYDYTYFVALKDNASILEMFIDSDSITGYCESPNGLQAELTISSILDSIVVLSNENDTVGIRDIDSDGFIDEVDTVSSVPHSYKIGDKMPLLSEICTIPLLINHPTGSSIFSELELIEWLKE